MSPSTRTAFLLHQIQEPQNTVRKRSTGLMLPLQSCSHCLTDPHMDSGDYSSCLHRAETSAKKPCLGTWRETHMNLDLERVLGLGA